MRIAVCDDDEVFLVDFKEKVKVYRGKQTGKYDVFTFSNGNELLAAHEEQPFDAFFFDIRMAQISGWELAEQIRQKTGESIIVFMSGFIEYIPHAFTYRAFSFLPKPFEQINFDYVFGCVLAEYQRRISDVYELKNEGEVTRIRLFEIYYFDILGRTMTVHTRKGNIAHHIKMEEAENKLAEKGFVRCHKSFLTNMRYIEKIEKADILLENGERIPLSKHKREKVKREYLRYKSGLEEPHWTQLS